ncbi:hypothetical protein WN944_011304 [Citrus x changshan-huyou]|uniref:Uncharacterized protein n=1 Tax=Citrus x changshan-huyou TaxID=2935761 RepID=A0AAP0MVC8_9ROSI
MDTPLQHAGVNVVYCERKITMFIGLEFNIYDQMTAANWPGLQPQPIAEVRTRLKNARLSFSNSKKSLLKLLDEPSRILGDSFRTMLMDIRKRKESLNPLLKPSHKVNVVSLWKDLLQSDGRQAYYTQLVSEVILPAERISPSLNSWNAEKPEQMLRFC